METLQKISGILLFSSFIPRFDTTFKELDTAESAAVRMGSRMRSLKLISSAWNPCVCKVGGSVWRPLILEKGRQPGHVARAGQLRGLGISLKKGYVMKDHVIVDENHAVDSTGDVIEKLKLGFKKFKEGDYRNKPELYAKLAEGQEPKVMMITCADSRVCPTMLHGLEAGEAFIVRNVANMVPPCEGSGEHHGTSAAIQFAVTVLQVEHIVVMGHSSCGGIRALMTREDFSGDFVGSWVRIGLPAKQKTLSLMGDKSFHDQCSFCEQESVNVSLANLLTFPFIEERVQAGKLHIHGMHYDFVEGKLTSWKVTPEEPGSPASSNNQPASAKASSIRFADKYTLWSQ